MFLKTHMRQWLLLGSLSIAFAACGGGSKSGDPENPPCDEATCNANDQTCDYINNVCVDCLDTPDCGSGKVCDRATHTCVEGECTVDTECSSGQHCVDNHCVSGIDCDSENLCPNHGICGTDGKCMTTSSVDCADLGEGELPTNAVQVDAKVEISWSPTSGWTTPDKCGWKCAEGYTQHGNECLEDEGCDSAADCTNADCVNGACVASQTVNCAEATSVPENATANAQSEVTINFVNGAWEAVPSCGWTCDEGYTLNETQDACEAVTTAPVCGNGILEAGEACDTGANVEPATPVFPEGATCTSEKNDGKSYSGELACASDCGSIETTACVENTPEPECATAADCTNADCIEGACVASQTVNCAEATNVPENATANAQSEVTINFVNGAWEAVPSCGWTCDDGYALNETQDACVELEAIPVFFSEYIKGSNSNKAIEVYNAGENAISCKVKYHTNSASEVSATTDAFQIAPKDVYVICHASADEAIKAACDMEKNSIAQFNGDDTLELVCGDNDQLADIFGEIGQDPGTKWTANDGAISTTDTTLRRKCSVTVGVTSNESGFPTLGTEWDAYAKNTFDGLGSHCSETPAPECTTDDECADGEVCTDGECVAGEDPTVCEAGCGTGEFEGQLCVVDDMNPNGVWTICDNGCADGACIVNEEDSCVGKDEYYCMEQNENTLFCNETTGQCVECLDNSEEYGCAEGYECNTATNTCQALCGNGVLNEGEECDPGLEKSEWQYSTCEAYGAFLEDTLSGEISCSETCVLDITSCDEPVAVNWCRLQSHGGSYAVTLDETTTTSDFYGQINVEGVTGNGSGSDKIRGEFIYWDGDNQMQTITATKVQLDSSSGGDYNDQWMAAVSLSNFAASGSYNYSWRFTADDGMSWYYCHNEQHANSDGGSGSATTSASDVIAENNIITITKPTAETPRVHTQTFDFITSSANNYTTTETTTDENGVTWTYVGRPKLTEGDSDYSIDGKGVIMRNKDSTVNKIIVSGFSGVTQVSFQYNWWGAKTDVTVTTKTSETGDVLETKDSDITGTDGMSTAVLTFSESSTATYLEITPKTSGNRIIIDNLSITE
ncbi:MAG: hypothetical protein IKC51_00525 [Myxococcaceae bacterium]|nr:hypothetical protein [Myxococcaceae bacterium]